MTINTITTPNLPPAENNLPVQPLGVCPHCGYCPHCGRRNTPPPYQQPYYPVWSGLNGGSITYTSGGTPVMQAVM